MLLSCQNIIGSQNLTCLFRSLKNEIRAIRNLMNVLLSSSYRIMTSFELRFIVYLNKIRPKLNQQLLSYAFSEMTKFKDEHIFVFKSL